VALPHDPLADWPSRERADRPRRQQLGAHGVGTPAHLGPVAGESGHERVLVLGDRGPQAIGDGALRTVPNAPAVDQNLKAPPFQFRKQFLHVHLRPHVRCDESFVSFRRFMSEPGFWG
jgi:hypothetical protein